MKEWARKERAHEHRHVFNLLRDDSTFKQKLFRTSDSPDIHVVVQSYT
jgi:hypothetical protein